MNHSSSSSMLRARWIYLRTVGLCFTATFFSLIVQIRGLAGPRGIFPAGEILADATFFKTPSLFIWLTPSNEALVAVLAVGLAASLFVIANRWNRFALFLCWLTYLSIASVAPYFTWYKAESLLLECAVLGLFLAPGGWRPGLGESQPPTRISLYAHLWLLFRLMLETGLTKFFSPDPAWKDLDAMSYFHTNMPFPTWVGWFFSKLPYGVHRLETLLTLFSESIAPVLLFCGRRARLVGLLLWFCLQTGIILSGNFVAFNYLSIGLGILFVGYNLSDAKVSGPREARQGLFLVPQMFLGFLLLLTFPFYPALLMPSPIGNLLKAFEPFRSVNQYILYPFIERERRVVVFEGQTDEDPTWREYGYRWQTQALNRRPEFLAPLSNRFERETQRLLERPNPSSCRTNPFVLNVAAGLIDGVSEVHALFAKDPFGNGAPRRVRAQIYLYEATDLGTLLKTGHWWTRRSAGFYCPEIARQGDGSIGYVDQP